MVTGPVQPVAAMAAIMAIRWSLALSTVPPGSDGLPTMMSRSGSSWTSAPRAVRAAVMVESRSLSFIRSRAAFVKRVVPERTAAITARGGSRSGQPETSISASPGRASFQ